MRTRYALLVLLVAISAACSDDDGVGDVSSPAAGTAISSPGVTVTPSATEAPVTSLGPSSGTDLTVGILDFQFDPKTVNVPVGGSVTWTNNDDQPHTATSAGNFDAGAIESQASTTVTFDTAGTFTYICSFHPFMTGTVIVG